MSTPKQTPDGKPLRCCICVRWPDQAPPITPVPLPIGSRNILFPAWACIDCWDRLFTMLADLPWMRYQVSQYVIPRNRPNYGPDGLYFGNMEVARET